MNKNILIFKYIIILVSSFMSIYLGYICRLSIFGYSGPILYFAIFNIFLLFYLIFCYLYSSEKNISVKEFLGAIRLLFFIIFHVMIWSAFFKTLNSDISAVINVYSVLLEKIYWTPEELSLIFNSIAIELNLIDVPEEVKKKIVSSVQNPEDLRKFMVEFKKTQDLLSELSSGFIAILMITLSFIFIASSVYTYRNINNLLNGFNRVNAIYNKALNETRVVGADLLLILEELDLIFNKLQSAYPHFSGSYRFFHNAFKVFTEDKEFMYIVNKYNEIRGKMRFLEHGGGRLGGVSDHSRLLDEND